MISKLFPSQKELINNFITDCMAKGKYVADFLHNLVKSLDAVKTKVLHRCGYLRYYICVDQIKILFEKTLVRFQNVPAVFSSVGEVGKYMEESQVRSVDFRNGTKAYLWEVYATLMTPITPSNLLLL